MPAAFTPAQMGQLARAADARMALAARSAPDGEVIQFLAGAPELLARYRNAPPAARALIDAAMDARRLGMGAGLPQAFLEAAAPGYLTDAEWDALGEDWLEQALAYTAVPCKGARGPLTRIRPRPARHAARNRGDQPASMAAAAGPLYRLADYLDQHGRAHRASQIPPAEFWSAAAAHAAPGDQAALGDAAHARGLYRDAAQLHKNAAASGNPGAAFYLSRPPACLRADPRPARWAAAHAPLDDPGAVADLLDSLRRGGRGRAGRRAAGPGSRRPRRPRRPGRVAACWTACGRRARTSRPPRWPAGPPPTSPSTTRAAWPPAGQPAGGGRGRAGRRAAGPRPAAHAPSTTRAAWPGCWTACGEAGADEQAAALAGRDRRPRPPRRPGRRGLPAGQPAGGGRAEQAAALAGRAAAHAPSTTRTAWPGCWTACGGGRGRAGRRAGRPGRRPRPPRRPDGVASLLEACGRRARTSRPPRWPPGRRPRPPRRPVRVAGLLDSLRGAGAHEQAAALAGRAAAHAPLDDPGAVAGLLGSLREAGADEQAAALLARDPPPTPPSTTRAAWPACWTACGRRARTSRPPRWLARDPAAHAPLDDPGGVASLLDACGRRARTSRPPRWPARAAAHAPSTTRAAWPRLLDGLREAGAHEQAAALADRLPAAGMFGLFLEQQGPADQFRFGREADGTPAAPWGWEDLDLWLVPRRRGP